MHSILSSTTRALTRALAKLGRAVASAILAGALTIPAHAGAMLPASRVVSGPKLPKAPNPNARLPSQGSKQSTEIANKGLTKQDWSAIADANHPDNAKSVGKLVGAVQKMASFTEFNRENAQDIGQNAILKLWQFADVLAQDPPANTNAYVRQAVRSAAVDVYHDSESWKTQQAQKALTEKMPVTKTQPAAPVVGKPVFSFEFNKEILEFPYFQPKRPLPDEDHTDSANLELQAGTLPEPSRVREARELAEWTLSVLKPIERRIFLLISQDFTHGEIASELGLKPATVKKTIDRTRDRLKFRHAEIASELGLKPATVKKTIDRTGAQLKKSD